MRATELIKTCSIAATTSGLVSSLTNGVYWLAAAIVGAALLGLLVGLRGGR